ncbi:unnamed protein product [Penicillium salamii]|uniref:Kinetochore Mis14 n=1 Tax=Penicillium salamii TaxID=1612424 RepID=A0A9W4NX20_9EURO|nr:unnamed protein product [Penicillium salamii]CAG8194204.1 unnamed protein product [Penicillium salamii]CAG8307140.1 unnamed protein product [Penicillium salamii]CAG8360330.1 unnamed protein product [Penicillium salamii]CAG8406049.1 unnamed protein product [Penicillium salamii]
MAHHRRIELQSPADFTYLYANTVALSRRQLDLHIPPSASEKETPDPMRERVRELVDEYIHKTFDTASASISINGIDSTSSQFPFPAAFTEPVEQVEYEQYDSELAARVTSLYAQLESLNTTVAQHRRDAPRRAAKEYAAQLKMMMQEDEDYENELANSRHEKEDESMEDQASKDGSRSSFDPAWRLEADLGTEEEQERWKSGDIAGVYEDTLRILLRLQGEGDAVEVGAGGEALATTVGKAERAGRAAEVVEDMMK